MEKFRMVRTDFWKHPMVMEEMSPEEKYFYLYILTNPNTTQSGIYKLTKKQMAYDLGYSMDCVTPMNCIESSLDLELTSEGKGSISFRKMKKDLDCSPALRAFFRGRWNQALWTV